MGEWRPIETAPRDGTRIDIWRISINNRERKREGERLIDCWWEADDSWDGGHWMRSGYMADPAYKAEDGYSRVSHWMPLPEPPDA